MNQSQERTCKDFVSFIFKDFYLSDAPRTRIEELNVDLDGKSIILQARLQSSRMTGPKMVFLNLRQKFSTCQALAVLSPETSKQMIKYIAS